MASMSLSWDNRRKVTNKVWLALGSMTFSHRIWENLMGSLNHAAEVVSFGHLMHCCLSLEGNRAFPLGDWDCL